MAKQMSHSDPEHYTDPELRDKIKAEVMKGDKGGKPGQWSARKAQLVASEYEKQGGGYKQGPDAQQQSLQKWGEEKWRTADGKKAQREGGTARYLPDEAWKSLSKSEQEAANKKKRQGSREGKQFVANTEKAAEARKQATAKKATAKTATAKTATAKTATAKTATAKTATAKTATAKTSATKKAATKKSSSSQSAAAANKPPARKTPAKGAAAKKAVAGKAVAGKTAAGKSAAGKSAAASKKAESAKASAS